MKKKKFDPENIEGMSQAELKQFAKDMKRRQERSVTYYPEEYDETQGIYSKPLVLNEQEQGK